MYKREVFVRGKKYFYYYHNIKKDGKVKNICLGSDLKKAKKKLKEFNKQRYSSRSFSFAKLPNKSWILVLLVFMLASGFVFYDHIRDVTSFSSIFSTTGFTTVSDDLFTISGSGSYYADNVVWETTLNGTVAFGEFGNSVASGDVNNDGYDDMIVGTFFADVSGVTTGSQTFVFFGTANGIPNMEATYANISFNGTASVFGESVASSDINQDGYDDVIVGGYKADPSGVSDAGQVFVFFGADYTSAVSYENTYANITLNASVANDNFGRAVASGDINNDGYKDIIAGASNADPSEASAAGQVYVFFGANYTSAINEDNSLYANITINGTLTANFLGRAVAGGDVNQDGYADIIIGGDGAQPLGLSNAGQVYVLFGANYTEIIHPSQNISGYANITVNSTATNNYLGRAVASGDINQDGYADIVIGVELADPSGASNAGQAFVFFGSNYTSAVGYDDTYANITFNGSAAGDEMGYSVGSGDVNNDGYDDMILGAVFSNPLGLSDAGQVYVFFGANYTSAINENASLYTNITLNGTVSSDAFGTSVASGDVDNDGYKGIIVGSFQKMNDVGRAYVYSYDAVAPVVNLDYPADLYSETATGNVTFNYTATDTNLDTCELWGDWTGTWHLNETFINPASGVTNGSSNITIEDGNYVWNVWCNDTLSNSGFNNTNYTLIIDIIPSPGIEFVDPTPSDGTSTTNTSVEINISITDASDLADFTWNWNGTNYTFYNDSLMVMYNFDNISNLGEEYNDSNGTIILDVSRYGNNATLYVGPDNSGSYVTGKYGGAYDFDGDDDYVIFNDNDDPANYTIVAWVKPDDVVNVSIIVNSAENPNSAWYYQLRITDSKLEHYAYDETYGGISVTGDTTLQTGTWYQVVGTFTAYDNLRLYVNGIEEGTPQTTETLWTAGDRTYIGSFGGGFGNFSGIIDEVLIWNRTLSSDEIQQLYMSNLRKYDTDKWEFYVNQSKNATDGLDTGTYTYYGFANDSAGNENQTETRTITINGVAPVVNLDYPADLYSETATGAVVFNYTATDTDLDTCELWGGWSSGWHLNETFINPTSGVTNGSSNITIEDGNYVWNVWCNDTLDNSGFNSTNYTLIVETTEAMSFGSGYVFSGGADYISLAALGSSKIVVAYADVLNASNGTVKIGEINNNTVEFGQEYTFSNDSTQYISVAALNESTFVVAYNKSGGLGGEAIIGDVDGTTVSFGDEYSFAGRHTLYVSVAALNSTQFVLGYGSWSGIGDDPKQNFVRIGDVASTAISYGTAVSGFTGNTAREKHSVAAFNSTKVILSYDDTTGSNNGYAAIGSVSSNDINFGTEEIFSIGSIGQPSTKTLNETKYIIAYADGGNSNRGTTIIGDVDNQNIVNGSEYVFNLDSSNISTAVLNESEFIVAYTDEDNSKYGTAIIADVDGTTIIPSAEYVFNSNTATYISTDNLSLIKFAIAFNDSDEGAKVIIGNVSALDTDPPIISLDSPIDFANFSTTLDFNYTATDTNLDTCELWGNWTSGWHLNETFVRPTSGAANGSSVITIKDGNYVWSVYCNDTANNYNNTVGNHTLTVDTTPPLVLIDSPAEGATYSTSTIDFNYTIIDDLDNLDSVWYTNDSGVTNITLTSNITFTSLSNAGYTLTLYANDTLNNLNETNVTFTVSIPAGVVSNPGGGYRPPAKEEPSPAPIPSPAPVPVPTPVPTPPKEAPPAEAPPEVPEFKDPIEISNPEDVVSPEETRYDSVETEADRFGEGIKIKVGGEKRGIKEGLTIYAVIDEGKPRLVINFDEDKGYPEHCYNGIKDIDEEGVDCGESCAFDCRGNRKERLIFECGNKICEVGEECFCKEDCGRLKCERLIFDSENGLGWLLSIMLGIIACFITLPINLRQAITKRSYSIAIRSYKKIRLVYKKLSLNIRDILKMR